MKAVNMIVQDDDMKVLKPLLDKLDIDYTQKTIKEVEDPEAIELMKTWKDSDVLSVSETKKALNDIGINV